MGKRISTKLGLGNVPKPKVRHSHKATESRLAWHSQIKLKFHENAISELSF